MASELSLVFGKVVAVLTTTTTTARYADQNIICRRAICTLSFATELRTHFPGKGGLEWERFWLYQMGPPVSESFPSLPSSLSLALLRVCV